MAAFARKLRFHLGQVAEGRGRGVGGVGVGAAANTARPKKSAAWSRFIFFAERFPIA